MPATCKICGAQNPANAYYCGICGASLTSEKFIVIAQSKIDTAKADLQKYEQELEQTKRSLSTAQSTISSLRSENAQLRKKKTLTQKIKAWWDNLDGYNVFGTAIFLVIGTAIFFGIYYLDKSSKPQPIKISFNYPVFKDGSVTYNGKTIASNLDTAYINSRSSLIITEKDGKKDLYEYSGRKILPQSYDFGPNEDNYYWYRDIIPAKDKSDEGWSLFNRNTGKRISDDYFYWDKSSSWNTAIVRYAKEKSSYGVIDINGEFVVPPVMRCILTPENLFGEDIFSCKRDSLPCGCEFYKFDGTLIASFPEATDCGAFSEGFASLKERSSNRICFIDTLGNKVTDYIYTSHYNNPIFINGKAIVRLNGVKGTIDKNFVFTPDEPK